MKQRESIKFEANPGAGTERDFLSSYVDDETAESFIHEFYSLNSFIHVYCFLSIPILFIQETSF